MLLRPTDAKGDGTGISDPPAYLIGWRALEDYRCGHYVLRNGTIVRVLPWPQQRDARWWPHALRSGSLGW